MALRRKSSLFAAGTTVPASRSRAELEDIVAKYSQTDAAAEYSYGTSGNVAAVQFAVNTPLGRRRVRFSMNLPTRAEFNKSTSRRRSAPTFDTWLDKETRRLWRCLVLQVKARFIELAMNLPGENFDTIFLAHIVGTSGVTVYEALTAKGDGLSPLLLCPNAEARSTL